MIWCKISKAVIRINSRQLHFTNGHKFIGNKARMGDESRGSRGVHLSEIYGSQSPWGSPEFPLVSPAFDHAVLYHIPSDGIEIGMRPPKPQIGQDKWDHEFVRMPCSSQSLYPVEANGTTSLKQRWQIIKEALEKPMECSQDLAEAILSYNTKFKTVWRFRALHKLFTEYLEEEESDYFFRVTLPEIAKLALSLPKLIQAPIPLLKQHKNRAISLSQLQIASLLANAFFCTFPRRNTFKKASEYASYPHINFNTLYESSGSERVLEKLKCLCHYFRRVCTRAPVGVVTYIRRSVPPRRCPVWMTSDRLLASTPLQVNASGTIEDDGLGLLQVDFANKYLGGGVLNRGCVQEEIRFVICPELLVSMLFTEVMRPNEAVLMIGCERYSRYTGYGDTFQFAGDHNDVTPRDSSGRRRCAVLAIDALPFAAPKHQYKPVLVLRELNKAWVGFTSCSDPQPSSLQYPGVATGNWGCGAFGGSAHLKALLQLMAATEARRPMVYYTFGDVELRNNIINMYNLLATHNVTVGQLYKIIVQFSQTEVRENQLYPFILQSLVDRHRPGSSEPMETSATSDTPRDGPNDSPDLFSQPSDESLNLTADTSKSKPNGSIAVDTSKDNSVSATKVDTSKVSSTDLAARLQANVNRKDSTNNESRSPVRISKFFKTLKQPDNGRCETPEASKSTEPLPVKKEKPSARFSLVDEMDRLEEESGYTSFSDAKRRKSILEADFVDAKRVDLGLEVETKTTISKESTRPDSDKTSATNNARNHETASEVATSNEKAAEIVVGCLSGSETNRDPVQKHEEFIDNQDPLNITVSNDVKKKMSKKITDYFNSKT